MTSFLATTATLDLLEEWGPSLGRPLVGSTNLASLKELRPGSVGKSEIRFLFVFDPKREAVLLTVVDKAGQWRRWYENHIPLAEQCYALWLSGHYQEEQ